jgi:cytochrome b pre-mRNA-processing protein 3
MRFPGHLRGSRVQTAANHLYSRIVTQSRLPAFYVDYGVPDTPDGRFDMIALHAVLVLRRLRRDHERTAPLAQALFDLMFADMDQNLREMGVGDLSVGKRVKALAKAFYGRLAAYNAGLDGADVQNRLLTSALRRNVYRNCSPPKDEEINVFTRYVCREAAALDALDTTLLIEGRLAFGAPPSRDITGST